jgi:hypothetical protein
MASWFSPVATVLGGALLLGEAAIGARAVLAPDVTAEYRAVYIEHVRACWQPGDVAARTESGLRRAEIVPASMSHDEACYVLAKGWEATLPGPAIMRHGKALLMLPPPPGATALVLTLRAARGEAVSLRVADGAAVSVVLAGGVARDVVVPVAGSGDVWLWIAGHYPFAWLLPDQVELVELQWRA